MRFGSVCSGIEAASVAWEPLGWKAAWFAEIEPFPSAVLAHHYPSVPNLGDMTAIAKKVMTGEVEAPDMLCGGTPCQAFSVAGLRQSLADDRGNLTLKFVELADAIDHIRVRAGKPAAVVFWENVPGVLSTADNAFGCFLAGLAGEDEPLHAPGGKWSNAGAVYGPARAVAWRTLDAQYFGVAQRRRRVFVVASARNDFDPATVLFEWDGLRRDTAPGREAGQTAPTIPSRSTAGGGLGTDFDCDGGLIAKTLCAGWHSNNPLDENLVAFDSTQITSRANGSNPKPGDACHPLAAGAHAPAIAFHAGNLARGAGSPPNSDVFPTLKADHGRGLSDQHPCVAFPANLSGTQHASTENLAPSMGAKNPTAVAQVTAFQTRGSNIDVGEISGTIGTNADRASGSAPMMQVAMQVRRLTPVECERLQGFPDDYTAIPWRKKPASECPDGPRYKALGNSWAVPNVRWIGWRIHNALKLAERRAA